MHEHRSIRRPPGDGVKVAGFAALILLASGKLRALDLYRKAWGVPADSIIYKDAAEQQNEVLRQELQARLPTRTSRSRRSLNRSGNFSRICNSCRLATKMTLEDASDDTMLAAFNDLNKILKENDNVLIYYAGNGSRQKTPAVRARRVLVMADSC